MRDPASIISRFERLAENAYEAMYDARPLVAKSHYEDAMLFLGKALAEAERTGDVEAVIRLDYQRQHVRNVFNHQFRGIG